MEVSYTRERGGREGEGEGERNGSHSTRTIRESKIYFIVGLAIFPPGSPHFAVCHAYYGMRASATRVSILCMHTE